MACAKADRAGGAFSNVFALRKQQRSDLAATVADYRSVNLESGDLVNFVEVGYPEIILFWVIVALVVLGLWKIVKLLWAAFSG